MMKRKIVAFMVTFLLVFGSSTVLAKGGGGHSGGHSSSHSSSSHSTSHSTSSGGKTTSTGSHSTSSSSKPSVGGGKSTSPKAFSEALHSTPASKPLSATTSYSAYSSSHNSNWPLIMRPYYFMNSQDDEDEDKKDEANQPSSY